MKVDPGFMNFKIVCQGLASFLPRPPQTRPPPLPQAAFAMLAISGARPNMKRSADESEPPTSTLAADAIQSMMEEDTKQGQNGPSNRSGGVFVLHDENVLGGGVLSFIEKRRRMIQREATPRRCVLQKDPRRYTIRCASCKRAWKAYTTVATTRSHMSLVCQWCKNGPLCKQCRLGPKGHLTSCNACVEAMPACLSRMVDVFPIDIEKLHTVAARWALISARVVSAHAATRE